MHLNADNKAQILDDSGKKKLEKKNQKFACLYSVGPHQVAKSQWHTTSKLYADTYKSTCVSLEKQENHPLVLLSHYPTIYQQSCLKLYVDVYRCKDHRYVTLIVFMGEWSFIMKMSFTQPPYHSPLGPGESLCCGVDVMDAMEAGVLPSVQHASGSMYSSTVSTTTTSSTSGLMSIVLPSDELVSSSYTDAHRWTDTHRHKHNVSVVQRHFTSRWIAKQ